MSYCIIAPGLHRPYNTSLAQTRQTHEYQTHRQFRDEDLAFGVRSIKVDSLLEDMFALIPTVGPVEAAAVIRPMLRICKESPAIYNNG